MRNYWMRIALGALAIFVVGMVGVTLVRRSVGGVRAVAEGTGPITLPVMFVPFKLNGEKLGTVKQVVLHRDAPKRLAAVELRIDVSDSVLARGLEGCRLAANLDDSARHGTGGREAGVDPVVSGVFSCLRNTDSTPGLQEFGHAVFRPGDVSVPLFLPNDIVEDLKQGHFDSREAGGATDDPAEAAAEALADSIAAEAEARAESIASVAEQHAAAAAVARRQKWVDSVRAEGLRRADSARRVLHQMADSARSR
jgi:hypothetical protein